MLSTLLTMAIYASSVAPQPAAQVPEPDCKYDRSILALDFDAFDQDMNGGWRAIANRPGCEQEAAELIKFYRERQQRRIGTLYWHEAQLHAMGGDAQSAIPLMRQSRRAVNDGTGWNEYVDASIAFLKGDKRKLLAARSRLAAVPPPSNRRCVDTKGNTVDCGDWPSNLDVVDGFISCFGKSYREAYSEPTCRAPAAGSISR
jgi:hypothetical protein